MGRHHLLLLRVIIIILLSATNASTTEWHTRMGGESRQVALHQWQSSPWPADHELDISGQNQLIQLSITS